LRRRRSVGTGGRCGVLLPTYVDVVEAVPGWPADGLIDAIAIV
jgi:hypothetical protein